MIRRRFVLRREQSPVLGRPRWRAALTVSFIAALAILWSGVARELVPSLHRVCAAESSATSGANDENGRLLFAIGQPDDSGEEFALAPGSYGEFPNRFAGGVLYIAGESQPGKDWPYIHPGPSDAWANSREWTLTVRFTLPDELASAAGGQALLTVDLVGAHPAGPSQLAVLVNGKEVGLLKPEPGNDAPVYATAKDGEEQILKLAIAAGAFQAGTNELSLRTRGGSWVVYDALRLEFYAEGIPAEKLASAKKDPWEGVKPVVLPGVLVVAESPRTEMDRALLVSLQGLVNRDLERLYLGSKGDLWFQNAVSLNQLTLEIDNPLKVVEAFLDEIRGIVIYDPALADTLNIAFTLAGLEDAIVVHPDLEEVLRNAPFNLPVIEDLRGRWKNRTEAYRWAVENLWPRANHEFFMNVAPQQIHAQDLLVAEKGFAAYLSTRIPEERALLERIYRDVPAGLAVYGWPDDPDGNIRLASETGHYYVAGDWNDNLSVFRLGRAPVLVPNVPAAAQTQVSFDPEALYVTFIMDNAGVFHYNQFHMPNVVWADTQRGKVPIGWTLNPRLVDLAPGIAEWYYRTATPNDEFGGPPNLTGLTDPWVNEYWEAILDQALPLYRQAGWRWVWLAPNGPVDDPPLVALAKRDAVDGIFLGRGEIEHAAAVRWIEGIPVVSGLYTRSGEKPEELAGRILRFSETSGERFVFIGVNSWEYGPAYVAQTLAALSPLSTRPVIPLLPGQFLQVIKTSSR